jgi:SAM-dependent methyltransferase
LAAAAADDGAEPATVLDPLCGRGTTLNWALAYGLHAIGIEPDRAALDQHAIFLETWAKRSRLPHKAQRYRDGNAEHRFLTVEVAPDRPTLKSGQGQTVATFQADGADESLPVKKASIDAIVTDLPYGVQHRGSSSGAAAETFNPPALLDRMLPTWRRWLRAGGSLCLAWNLKQADRDAVTATMRRHGFDPVVAAGGFTMRHVVDATIDRDVLCAVRAA